MNTVVYLVLGATIVLAIATLIQLRSVLVATLTLNARAAFRAAGTAALLFAAAVILAICTASAPALFLPALR